MHDQKVAVSRTLVTLSIADIAAMLKVAPGTARNNMPRYLRAGFPPPLPVPGVRRWSAASVEDWLRRNGVARAQPVGEVDAIAMARAVLEARLDGRAA